eukprot:NODE_2483_length_531_cov_7.174274_g1973_i0.p1 GENE.NODE_2483_length_531_cov_7.174274_g1973_i0~~NODE_2483_length_531_cov_7.174274_g1973_i0.p1  ORF type:complete len:120 (+),score=20.53 NODE_2483_length_531_cov_7.174274_g1973_i0:101-460(+)
MPAPIAKSKVKSVIRQPLPQAPTAESAVDAPRKTNAKKRKRAAVSEATTAVTIPAQRPGWTMRLKTLPDALSVSQLAATFTALGDIMYLDYRPDQRQRWSASFATKPTSDKKPTHSRSA